MKLQVVSVYDRALGAFGRPVFVPSVGAAVRSFQDEVNNPQGEIVKHPEDYELFHLGEWLDDNAAFYQLEAPKRLAVGKDLVK